MKFFTDTKGLSEKGAWVHVKNGSKRAYLPDADGKDDLTKPVRIKVYGPDSPTAQDRIKKLIAKRIKEAGGNLSMKGKSVSEIEASIESGISAEPEHWAALTMTWENMPEGVADFTQAAAVDLYTQFPAILRQLAEDAGDIGDFLALAETV